MASLYFLRQEIKDVIPASNPAIDLDFGLGTECQGTFDPECEAPPGNAANLQERRLRVLEQLRNYHLGFFAVDNDRIDHVLGRVVRSNDTAAPKIGRIFVRLIISRAWQLMDKDWSAFRIRVIRRDRGMRKQNYALPWLCPTQTLPAGIGIPESTISRAWPGVPLLADSRAWLATLLGRATTQKSEGSICQTYPDDSPRASTNFRRVIASQYLRLCCLPFPGFLE